VYYTPASRVQSQNQAAVSLTIYPAIISAKGETQKMGNMSLVVQQLKKERERVHKQVERIDAALLALGSVSTNGAVRPHTMSVAARRKISLAQKVRWAKQKATPRRTISAAGRRRIAAAQRARWAKAKREKKAA